MKRTKKKVVEESNVKQKFLRKNNIVYNLLLRDIRILCLVRAWNGAPHLSLRNNDIKRNKDNFSLESVYSSDHFFCFVNSKLFISTANSSFNEFTHPFSSILVVTWNQSI